jgi:hypothetical protein
MRMDGLRRLGEWLLTGATLVCLLVPLNAGTARAQESPTPDTGYIFGYRSEIVFPAAVRFVVGMNVGLDQIASVSLTLRQQSGLNVTLEVDPQRYLLETGGVVTQLLYPWDLSTGPVPVSFEPLSFMWQVETKDRQISKATDEFLFVDDARGPWYVAGNPPLILHWLNPHLAGSAIRNEVMAAYGLLGHHTGLVPSPSYEFVIYDPNTPMCQQVVSPETNKTISVVTSREDESQYPCSVDAFRQVYARGGIIFLQRPTFGYSELEDLLIASMVRETYISLWQGASVPAWFLSGLTFMYRLHPSLSTLEVTRDAARTESLLPLSELGSAVPEDAAFQVRVLWEAESYLLTLYLADRYGADAAFDLALNIRQQGFDGALQSLMGGTQDNLWDEWSRWLFTAAAERAVAWTPYTDTTPTPTATPTITPIPPTFTPSMTPTITFTPTSTFLGDQRRSITPPPVTPTRLSSPTNTPLPPGSLPTAQPYAPDKTKGQGSSALLTAGIICIAVVAVVLVLLAALIWRRRR